MPALTSGQSITQRYTLVRRLGAGGMGEVWLVHDRQLDTEPAAKILVGAAPEQVDQLRQECLLARRLNHPNIVRVFDFEQDGEIALMTMEHISGGDPARWLGAPPEEILSLLIPVAEGLSYAHRQGVVHRDLKLSNILVDASGAPHIVDFGVAAALADGDRVEVFGGGSPTAMSPQQSAGAPARPADDLYAFGAILYELLSGRPPLWPELTTDRLHHTEPAPVHSPHPLPRGLRSLVSQLLAKIETDRPPDMEWVRLRLQSLVDGRQPASMRPTDTGQPGPTGETSAAGSASLAGGHSIVGGDSISAGDSRRLVPPPRIRPQAVSSQGPPTAADGDLGSRDRRLRYAAGIVFALLALAAITVFAVLPGWVARRPIGETSPTAAVEAPSTGTVSIDGGHPGGSGLSAMNAPEAIAPLSAVAPSPRAAAEEAREEAYRWRSQLTERAASKWGGEAFAQALQATRRGDQLFLAESFPAATAAFREATSDLRELDSNTPRILKESLERGRQALVQADSSTAREAFALALSLQPDNSAAAAGLRRAEALPRLLAQLDSGAERQRRGDLQGALEAYRRAAAIEPLSREARSAIDRLSAELGESAFSGAMATGLLALETDDFIAARDAFKQAAAERPGSTEAADGLARAESGLRAQAIAEHRRLADDATAVEDWHTAAGHYGQMLELDPTLAVAQRGQTLAESRAALGDRLAAHLERPQRLTTAAVRGDAEALVERASEIEAPGPVLTRQIATLTEAVSAYSRPIRIVLLSDERTTVEIYRVGLQGKFDRRKIDLLPGTYTVVGRRSGYQDVRTQLKISPGATPEPLAIRCEVKL